MVQTPALSPLVTFLRVPRFLGCLSYGLFSVTTFSRSYEREGQPRKTENEFSHDRFTMIQARIRRSRIRVRVMIRVRVKEVSDTTLTQ